MAQQSFLLVKAALIFKIFWLAIPLALVLTLTAGGVKGTGISLLFPIEPTTLRKMDVNSILNDVAKTGCWIHLAGNIMNGKAIQLAAQLGSNFYKKDENQMRNSADFLIPFLLRDVEKVPEKKYKKYARDGLSAAGGAKHSLCFINMFYWPLNFQIQDPENYDRMERFSKSVLDVQAKMMNHTESLALCSSFVDDGDCMRFGSSKIPAKFTVIFLEILEQGNVVSDGESSKSQNQKKEQQGNFPQPFFSKLLFSLHGLLFPLVAVTITTSKSTAAQENPENVEMKISGVWFLNHWNILKGQQNPESKCKNLDKKTRSSEKISCYSRIMSKNNKNSGAGTPKPQSTTESRFRFKTPADQTNPANFSSTLESFLNSIVPNETWKYEEATFESVEYWRSQKLNVTMDKAVPEASTIERLPLLWIFIGSKNYNFITSDSVRETKSTLQIYTKPFQRQVWTLLFVSMVITVALFLAFALVNIRNLKETSSKMQVIWKVLSELCLWILRILLEQPDQEIPPGIQSEMHQIHQTENFIKNLLKRAIRLILGVWLMMSLILVNGFRGIIKSDYTLDFPFASDPKWNSSTDFLKDGAFFVYYTQMDFPCGAIDRFLTLPFKLVKPLTRYEYSKPSFLMSRIWYRMTKLWGKCGSLCPFNTKMQLPFEKSGCQKLPPCQQFYKFAFLFARQITTCTEKLPDFITQKLRHPKTVFMTTAADFPFYWNLFKKQMKENPGLKMKFVHNEDEKDEDAQQIYGFVFDFSWSKVNRGDAEFLLGPLKILLSSGIFWWWEKWEQIKFHRDRQIWRNSSEFIDESLAVFKPLSFQDSDIHLVFLIWLFSLILPATAFLLEILSIDKILNRIWLVCKEKQRMIKFCRKERKLKVVQNLVIRSYFNFWLREE